MGKKRKHTYEYDIDIESDVAPARVLRMIEPNSKVLEIGAGPGSITRHLSGTLACDVVALEIDPTALAKLKPYARSIYPMDLNDAGWSAEIREKEGLFDYVIAADVLEHVYDPWTVLNGMKSLLNDGGSVVLSIPHVGHAAVAGCLVDEDFEYRNWGLLDRTHIRFFGIKNVQHLLASQGMSIEQAEFVVRTPEMTEFAHRWGRLPADVRASLQRNRFSHVFQVVSRSVPKERSKNNIQLMDLSVEAPDPATKQHWVSVMSRLPVPDHADTRSTMGDAVGSFYSTSAAQTNYKKSPGTASRIEKIDLSEPASPKIRTIAFYLPQFHPIPENDTWWGKGFTEWTNVTKAQPSFTGHYQPHLPADLGFYDLRVRETRLAQIEMAKTYGIDGFCYHYYWFAGKRLLERPLDEMLLDPESDMPFCLCWANENWTRRWDAAEHEVLIAQDYGPDSDRDFIESLIPFFQDPRYIRVDGAPLLIIYRPQHLPDPIKSIQTWRDCCAAAGIPKLHLVCALTHRNWDYKKYGFDAGVEFPPHNVIARNLAKELDLKADFYGACVDYHDLAERYLELERGPDNNVYRTVFPSWDNTARRHENALVVLNGTPENYEFWLARALRQTAEDFPDQERLVFINAWNEWAEGCHLEPDRKYDHAFLRATRRALQGSPLTGWTNVGITEDQRRRRSTVGRRWSSVDPNKPFASRAFHHTRDFLNGRTIRRWIRNR